MSRAITRSSVVSPREAVNRRDHHHVAGGELGHQLLELGPIGRRATDLLAENDGALCGLKLGHWLLRSWASVETRA
jgi:hypothetical protein